MPSPVFRFFTRSVGRHVPVIHSAVISGTGKLRLKGANFHARWRFVHCAGQGYRHYIEAALLGVPMIKVNEHYLDGEARFELPFGVVEHSAKLNLSANLTLWAESIWLPSSWLTDPRVHWSALDEAHSRLSVPSDHSQDAFVVSFGPCTGLITSLASMRYRDADDPEKIGWRNDIHEWKCFHGIEVPSVATVTWADELTPWLTLHVDDVVYNADVSSYIRASGI